MKPSLRRLMAAALAAQFVLTPPSQAAVISEIQPFDRTELRAKLEARSISDAEELATQIDTLPAGGISPPAAIYLFYLVLHAMAAGVTNALSY